MSKDYAEAKNELQERGGKLKWLGLATIVMAVALVIFSAITFALGDPSGLAFIPMSLPIWWLGINAYQVGENSQEMAKNPFQYATEAQFKRQMAKGTILFDFMIDNLFNK